MTSIALALLFSACAASIPEPPLSPQPDDAFQEVRFPPPPARAEIVPSRPEKSDAVWVDGEWTYSEARWHWQRGRWVVLPRGATFSKWATKRRTDGAVLFAPGLFRDSAGNRLPPPPSIASARTFEDGEPD